MKSYVVISITGDNPKRLLEKILNKKINIIYVKYLKKDLVIKVSYSDYIEINKIKAGYQIEILKFTGKKRLYDTFIKYRIPIISFTIGFLLFIFLSFNTFYINIDTNNKVMVNKIKNDLKDNGITLFSFRRSFDRLEQIKQDIKKRNDNIDWIELYYDGVVLNVKVIEKKSKYNNTYLSGDYTDIIAKKSGYIRKIVATSGDVLKNTDDYVNKGEIIITGNIVKNDEIVSRTKAKGLVYAEVWYIKKLSKDLDYVKLKKSGYSRKKIILKTCNKNINLLNIKTKQSANRERIVFSNGLFSLHVKTETQYKKVHTRYTDEEAIFALENKAENDIVKKLDRTEYITSQKSLKKYKENDKMFIEVLFKVYEEIGQTVKAREYIEKEE